jgi:putative MATE family efflux protein
MKDSIDFGKENVGYLFRKMLIPTVMSTVFTALFCITDGIFVGHGIGSDALAAVNIVVPLWLFATGVGLMFGMGASVIAAIHLANGKQKVARIVITQAVIVSSLFLILFSLITSLFATKTVSILGASPRLTPLSVDYLIGFIPFSATNALLCSGGFFIRLDGSPRYAMACSITSAVINIILDYLFIFPFGWGIFGAAIATSIGTVAGCIMILIYLFNPHHQLHFIRFKSSWNSVKLTIRNTGYMCRLGASSFLKETANSCMMLCGNLVMMKLNGDDGVAAWSIICYFYPIVFMLYNAIGLSAQPIISYNYGTGNTTRIKKAFLMALKTSIGCGILLVLITVFFSREIALLFVSSDTEAYRLAAKGLPLFATGFIFFAVSIVAIAYFQSVKQARNATLLTIMRGFIFMIICFVFLPMALGEVGAWLSVPATDMLATALVVYIHCRQRV